ncbi:hypothetical protein FLACOL7796_00264 [Flavobacterium collinsii]|uniref:Uncharacterized protein n=1 Tax=Flavobacterium collinsii TaxID=1114861 RepID=A0ABM8KDE1_9FLAO|nr:hypothetical protein FLACOL7796_00264 [Flavobacterium collinsii]
MPTIAKSKKIITTRVSTPLVGTKKTKYIQNRNSLREIVLTYRDIVFVALKGVSLV